MANAGHIKYHLLCPDRGCPIVIRGKAAILFRFAGQRLFSISPIRTINYTYKGNICQIPTVSQGVKNALDDIKNRSGTLI
jgi:hypothetical protein